jgi:protein TonB
MSLADFPRGHAPAQPPHRVAAGLLTACVYGLAGLLLWSLSPGRPMPAKKPEIVTTLIAGLAKKVVVAPVRPQVEKVIKPRTERPAPPVITTASGAPPTAPLPLPATAATESPLLGGTSGNGPMGQSASGAGGSGNGGAAGGCLDPVWMQAVSARVRQFFYYPDAALAMRTTGIVMVRFAVRRDGRIDTLEIGKSSGDAGLDKAALDILQRAQPLPPIPERMHADRIEGELPVNFGVRNFSGRASGGNC